MAVRQRVFLVRHGEGVHNAQRRYCIRDPPLTDRGKNQAASLQGHPSLANCELLVVSPLSRAVETAAIAIGQRPACRVVLSPLCSERWTGRCDEGRTKSQLVADFPFVADWEGFAGLPENWSHTQKSDQHWFTQRVPAFLDWLRSQPERLVVTVGHGAFFEGLSGKYLDNCEVGELFNVADVLQRIRGEDSAERLKAAAILGEMGKTAYEHVDEIRELLKDEDPEIRGNAAQALGKIYLANGPALEDVDNKRKVVNEVGTLLSDSDDMVQYRAAEALGDLCDTTGAALEEMLSLLQHEDSDLRQNASWALGQIFQQTKPEHTPAACGPESHGPEDAKRRRVVGSNVDAQTVAKKIAKQLDDEDPNVRKFAVEALGHMGDAAGAHATEVAGVLNDETVEVRQNALWSLGQMSKAAPLAKSIAQSLKDEDADARFYAVEALGKLKLCAEYLDDLTPLLQDQDVDVRKMAAQVLGQAGKPAARCGQALVALLSDAEAAVRENAVEALGRLGVAADCGAEVVKLLTDDDPDVLIKAAKCIGGMGKVGEQFSDELAALLSHAEADVRCSALGASTALDLPLTIKGKVTVPSALLGLT